MRRVVVGFVDVESAQKAVREAVTLALGLGADLHVVTAIDDPVVKVLDTGSEQFEVDDFKNAEQLVHNFMRSLDERPEYTVAVLEGRPADVLIAEAKRLDADLLVVGNVRMQGAGRVLGSVGSKVVHNAPCSVLIAKTV